MTLNVRVKGLALHYIKNSNLNMFAECLEINLLHD